MARAVIFGTIAAVSSGTMRVVQVIALGLTLMLLALPVRADDGADEPREPNRDRVGLTPTAWTLPRGSWGVSSTSVFLERLSYAATGRLQIDIEAFVPNPLFNMVGASTTFVLDDRGATRLAIHLDAAIAADHDQDDGARPYFRGFVVHDDGQAVAGSLVASRCLGTRCRWATTLIGRGGFADVDSEGYVELSLAAASTYRVGTVRLLVQGEVERCHANSDCYSTVGSVSGGVRVPWSRVALDIGWTLRFRDKEPDVVVKDLTEFGAPWFSITYRRL